MDRKLGGLALSALLVGCGEHSTTPQQSEVQAAPQRPERTALIGFELGQKIAIPECSKERSYGMVLYTVPPQDFPCWRNTSGARNTLKTEPDFPVGPMHNGRHDVLLDPSRIPSGIEDEASLLLIDGSIEEVWLRTSGPDSQELIFQQLVAKYGEPDVSNVQHLQNAMGATYDGITATWRFQAMTMNFVGVIDHESGAIVAVTKAGTAFMNERNPPPAAGF